MGKGVLAVPSQRENGSPLSLAKAKFCRDVDAMELIVIMMRSIRMTIVNTVAPAVESVAVWKT